MKIYTRTGDKGMTSLLRGGRVPKHDLRVEVYGTMDELNSLIGYIRALNDDPEVETVLARLQPKLHVLCSDVASPLSRTKERSPVPRLEPGDDRVLEEEIDRFSLDLPELKHFILPGGSPVGAALHLARTVCRRGERRLTELDATLGDVNPEAIRFVNRLSDHLFALARWANHRAGKKETPWKGE